MREISDPVRLQRETLARERQAAQERWHQEHALLLESYQSPEDKEVKRAILKLAVGRVPINDIIWAIVVIAEIIPEYSQGEIAWDTKAKREAVQFLNILTPKLLPPPWDINYSPLFLAWERVQDFYEDEEDEVTPRGPLPKDEIQTLNSYFKGYSPGENARP